LNKDTVPIPEEIRNEKKPSVITGDENLESYLKHGNTASFPRFDRGQSLGRKFEDLSQNQKPSQQCIPTNSLSQIKWITKRSPFPMDDHKKEGLFPGPSVHPN